MPEIIDFAPVRAVDLNGAPISGARATFFQAGTATPLTVYTTEDLDVAHPSPLIADASGLFPAVYAATGAVKVIVTDAGGGTEYTLDPAFSTSTSATGAGAISFSPTTDVVATDVQSAIELVDSNARTRDNLKANIASPTLTDTPAAPTASVGTNTTQIATTAFAKAEISAVVGVANAAVVKTALNSNGSAPIYGCRAWVNFNGSGTVAIRASGNVSSITDNGTGDYTINFTTAMEDANYAPVVIGHRGTNSGGSINCVSLRRSSTYSDAMLAGSCRVQTSNGVDSLEDALTVAVAIFR